MAEPGTPPVIGIIGGSGVYDIDGLQDAAWIEVDSPFGKPSDAFLQGTLDGQRLVFLCLGAGRWIPFAISSEIENSLLWPHNLRIICLSYRRNFDAR